MEKYRLVIKDILGEITYTRWTNESEAPYHNALEWLEKMAKFDYLTFEMEDNEKKIYFPNSIISIYGEWSKE